MLTNPCTVLDLQSKGSACQKHYMNDLDFVIEILSDSEEESEVDTKIRYWWAPGSCRGPFCRDVIEFTESSITFDGYFYDSVLPQQRILKLLVTDYVKGHQTHLKRLAIYHVEIYEKIEGADTSVVAEGDPQNPHEDDGVCFFPSNKITLKFRVLQKDFDDAEEKRILATFPQRQMQ